MSFRILHTLIKVSNGFIIRSQYEKGLYVVHRSVVQITKSPNEIIMITRIYHSYLGYFKVTDKKLREKKLAMRAHIPSNNPRISGKHYS